jgi:hypothetical protein
MFESNSLRFVRREVELDRRELEPYLDLAGCTGERREAALALAPPGYAAENGWYLLRRA